MIGFGFFVLGDFIVLLGCGFITLWCCCVSIRLLFGFTCRLVLGRCIDLIRLFFCVFETGQVGIFLLFGRVHLVRVLEYFPVVKLDLDLALLVGQTHVFSLRFDVIVDFFLGGFFGGTLGLRFLGEIFHAYYYLLFPDLVQFLDQVRLVFDHFVVLAGLAPLALESHPLGYFGDCRFFNESIGPLAPIVEASTLAV